MSYCFSLTFTFVGPLLVIFAELYSRASTWIHRKTDRALFERRNFHQRYFQRGDATAQLQFVQRRRDVFFFIFIVAALSTMGLLCTDPFDFGPETISNVFCKTDNERQLDCRVMVKYYDPAESAAEEPLCHCATDDWEFCGKFFLCR